ncbi:MAG: hypothetical protein HFE97_05455 [Oscillospiraceae bacterium]|nr:hypothetical protein [Oscillospiraceae bacterium]
MKHRYLAALLTAACLLTPLSSAAAYQDAAGSWAASVLEKARDYGLVTGYPNGTFGVGQEMSRAEFITVLCRMFGWENTPPASPSFRDCPANRWYFPAVETALAHGILDPDRAVRPEDFISREEMAVMLVRALGYTSLAESLPSEILPFSDVSSHPGYLAIAYDIGMITGIEQNGSLFFKPAFSAKREEAVAMLVRVYERYCSRVDWLHGFYAFSSYGQIDLTHELDALSLGWSRLEYDPIQGAALNSTRTNGNEWVIPSEPALATDHFQQNGTPYNLSIYADTAKTVSLSDGTQTSVVESVLASESVQRQAAQVIADAAGPYAGITLDFEGLRAPVKESYAAFVRLLRAALPDEKALYICVQPDTWYTGFDYRALGESCDKVILMAHDYQWASIPESYLGTTQTHSPVTPFPQIYKALQAITDLETGVQDTSKIALGISFGTAGFRIDGEGRLLERTIYHPAQETLAGRLLQPDTEITYSEIDRNPYAIYTTPEGERYLLWYEDAQSITDKIQLAKLFGITGVSLWRVGNLPTYPHYDIWSAILEQ